MKHKLLVISLLIFLNFFGQEPTLQGGDFTVSIGAAKNRFFEEDFDLFAPFSLPVSIGYGINKHVELNMLYNPTIFDDRSSVDLSVSTQARNERLGGIQSFGAGGKVSTFNDLGMLGFLEFGSLFSLLDQQQYINGVFHERNGSGYQLFGGFGLRYQLGNEYGDIYPWYFEISVLWTQHIYEIDDYRIEGEVQPRTDDDWESLNFGSIDAAIKVGYRLRTRN